MDDFYNDYHIDLLKDHDLLSLIKSVIEDDFNMVVTDFDRNGIYFRDLKVRCEWHWNPYKGSGFILITDIEGESVNLNTMEVLVSDLKDIKDSLKDAIYEYKGW